MLRSTVLGTMLGSRGPRPPFRLAPLLLAVLTLCVACLSGSRLPEVEPRGTLSLSEQGEGTVIDGPLEIVHAGPRGEATTYSEISIVFNKPMRALDLAGQEAPFPATITPAVPGSWHWVGTRAATFVPDRPTSEDAPDANQYRLPAATRFSVEVPAGTAALDGTALAEPYRFEFETPRPKIVSTSPGSGADGLEPDQGFDVRLNQPVSAAALRAALRLEVDGAAHPFSVEQPDPNNARLFRVAPAQPMALNKPVGIVVDASLAGTEGPLPGGKTETFSYRTYGPLAVQDFACNTDTPNRQCSARSGISFELSNPVSVRKLKQAVTVQPPVQLRWSSWMSDDDDIRYVSVDGDFKPGRSYVLRIKGGAAGIIDTHGQLLAQDHVETLRFDDRWPTAKMGLWGRVFEPDARREIPIASINVDDLEVRHAPLTEAQVLGMDVDPWEDAFSYEEIAALPGATTRPLRQQAAKNAVVTHRVATKSVLGSADARGPMAIGIRYTHRPGTRWEGPSETSAVVQVTDLGITAKVSRRGAVVWVSSLKTAQPVAGATVRIRRPSGLDVSAVTDASGKATFDASQFQIQEHDEKAIIFVRKDDDWAFRPAVAALDSWRFGIPFGGYSDAGPFGMLFTDRGIYRPGEQVRFKAILREEAEVGTRVPSSNGQATVEVTAPDGETISTVTRPVSAYGTLDGSFIVPTAGRLGSYGLSVSLGGGQSVDLWSTFEVAEFRRAEFSVGMESDKPRYVRGDAGLWTGSGDYLFGAPMAEAEATIYLTRSRTFFQPPGAEGFLFDDDAYRYDLQSETPSHLIEQRNTKLDERGLASLETKLTMPGQTGPELVTAEIEVRDLSRQVLAGSTSAVVHPGNVYVGLDNPDRFVGEGEALQPQVLVMTPDGKRISQHPVSLSLIRRTWAVAKQATGGSSLHSVSTPVDETVGSCDLLSNEAPASCTITPPSGGFYILRATTQDDRGNTIATSDYAYVTGGSGMSWPDVDSMELELVADKEQYEVGDTATILVKSPFAAAQALITVERDGVRTQQKKTISGAMATLQIPVTEDLRPNAYVSVLLTKGRTRAAPTVIGAPDPGAPSFRLGYAEIRINPEARRLKVDVKPQKRDLRPGEQAVVDVAIRDRAGNPVEAEVALYAVDEGVLSLIGYQTPDPVPVFGAPRDLRVETIESRIALAKTFNPFGDVGIDKGLDGGGGMEGGGAGNVRRDFSASATFQPSVITDASGNARVTFSLPDSLTTYRVMAVATTKGDRFGYGASAITASRPLMARPALPRFFRAGDVAHAGVIVTSKGLGETPVQVAVEAEGIEIRGDRARQIALGKNASEEVRFELAANKVGKAKLRFSVGGQGESDHVEVVLPVEPALSMETVALYGDTSGQVAERIGDMTAIRPDVGALELKLASTALVGLDGGAQQLIDYPYGCTEQLVSRLVPMLPLRKLADDYGFDLPPNTDAVIAQTVQKVADQQKPSGGFGLWKDSPQANDWVTAYALWGLVVAKEHGAEVPEYTLDSGRAYLREVLSAWDANPMRRAASTFVLYTLAKMDEPNPGSLDAIYQAREDLPLFSRALLLQTMELTKSDPGMRKTLADELEKSLVLSGPVARARENIGDDYAVIMHSDTRSSALVLSALLAHDARHPSAKSLAKGLLADRDDGAWRSTQETAFSLLALADYRNAQEVVEPQFDASVFFGKEEVQNVGFFGRSLKQHSLSVPTSRLAAAQGTALSFDVQGQGTLFYEARLRYARKELPQKPLDRGFAVETRLRRVEAATLADALLVTPDQTIAQVDAGALVLADVIVVTPKRRNYVVIDAPLPAGLEAVDTRLATTSSMLSADSFESSGYDDVATGGAFSNSWYRREVRDDRVLFFVDSMPAGMYRYRFLARATSHGTFLVPPTKAEEMYAPEVFGRTPGARFTVAEP